MLGNVAELAAERDALAKDAARYRWLRDWYEKSISQLADVHVPFNSTDAQVEQVIDAAIDAAMKETP